MILVLSLAPLTLIAPSFAKSQSKIEYPYLRLRIKFLDYIKQHEGLRLNTYICPAGYPTIGYGYKLRSNDTITHITPVQADTLLEKVFDEGLYYVLQDNLPIELHLPVLHFIYCLGCGTYQKSTFRKYLLRYIKSGDERDLKQAVLFLRKYNKYKYKGVYRTSTTLKEQRDFESKHILMFNSL